MGIQAAGAATAAKAGGGSGAKLGGLWTSGSQSRGILGNMLQDFTDVLNIYGFIQDAPLRQTRRNLARLQERQARRFETEEKRIMGVKNIIGQHLSQLFGQLRQ